MICATAFHRKSSGAGAIRSNALSNGLGVAP